MGCRALDSAGRRKFSLNTAFLLANARICGERFGRVHSVPDYSTMTPGGAILLVEDNDDDVFLMHHALNAAGVANPVFIVETGQQAVDYLAGSGVYQDRVKYPMPAIVFLDLKLPLLSGHEVLAWIRSQRQLESLVVVVLTSSNEPSDVRRSYSLGANSYLMKPMSSRQLVDLAKAFNWSWLERTPTPAVPPKS
jgi:CheY-like chemotaxis protein